MTKPKFTVTYLCTKSPDVLEIAPEIESKFCLFLIQ